jgi:RNA polymerase sigma factor (sigma-70 family)
VAHTRLQLKGARRMFLWELGAAIETVRDEEIAAAGVIPARTVGEQDRQGSSKTPKHWLKGAEGLQRTAHLSQYLDNLTEKQRLAFSLKHEYGLGPTEIASRMGIDRKTLSEHLDAANKKIEEDQSFQKRRINRSKRSPDE